MNERKLQILLVDDHAVVRGGLRLLLAQKDDMEVVSEADNAEQAISMIRQNEFDVRDPGGGIRHAGFGGSR